MSQAKIQGENRLFDKFKWLVVVALVALIVAGNEYYSQHAVELRLLGGIIVAIIAGLVALTTAKGKAIWKFMRESRLEMRKVTWPTRQETVQTTLVVAAFVVIMALVLWAADSLFAFIISNIIL